MKKVFNILIVFILLTGNTGITTVVHYCGGSAMLRSISTGTSVPDCGMGHSKYEGDENSGHGISGTDNCCVNSFLTHRVSDEYSKIEIITSLQAEFGVINPAKVSNLLLQTNDILASSRIESQPNRGRDIRIIFSSFLI